ncbi:Alpha-ketoglutarate-dependent sulfonate dioxygenase [Madurella fahalii]|uniref:Alpha-ketoglutarate-dependent sulfonate dioxygenase n=1 Tax=Madurella fahalii TaxID=1157608 RepID=A0ABQ0FWI4_9PEZI
MSKLPFKRAAVPGASGASDIIESPPPAYGPVSTAQQPPGIDGQSSLPSTAAQAGNIDANLSAALVNLTLSEGPTHPTAETCLAHLKLLFAIQWMKEDIGLNDGLWGLWDARAGPLKRQRGTEKGGLEASVHERMNDKTLEALSKIREKRWALFVARAVERYETWWKSLPGRPLTERDMDMPGSPVYTNFPASPNGTMVWIESMLPPLDVLMVWHTHMLNPRGYLEDAMLAGLGPFWSRGLPWDLINKAIDNDFAYNVSEDCKVRWVGQTGHAWDNIDDPIIKTIRCPRCSTSIQIPWTTCSLPEEYQGVDPATLAGNGYGDSYLRLPCPGCGIVICKELLSAAKFVEDTKALLGPRNRPMPGTLLEPRLGTPEPPSNVAGKPAAPPRTFPNRFLKSGCNSIRTQITGLITSNYRLNPTMDDVRKEIENAFQDKANLRNIEGMGKRNALDTTSRIAIRKMMSHYWENFSLFALDLCGAVMRQGIFVEKMCKLDWLHSPSARDTMSRLLVKYDRFFEIMTVYPHETAVPTLDVDLAWHTHQLSPSMYYAYSVSKTGRFIDHNDKIEETVLSKQFEWTSKAYQDRYGEVYSECTCWYCEAIRASHTSPVGKVLGLSKQEKIAESFHASGQASLCPPDASAHISSHNSVCSAPDARLFHADPGGAAHRRRVHDALASLHRRRLDAGYAKAKARAEKKGRPPPRRDDLYYDHWGYPYAYAGPYAYPLWWTPGLYFGWYPAYVVSCGAGAWGGCAAGTCGGGVGAGACGGAGGCGGDGAGGSGAGACGGGGGGGGGCGGCGSGGGGGGGGCGS